MGRAQRVLESARLNVQIANLLSVDSVALVERHALGSMLVSSEVAGALGSITPLESWQWPETARTEFLPFTFTGPMGRYRLGILVDGAETDSTQFTISPRALEQFAHAIETTNQVAVQTGGGGFPVGVAVVGVLGAAGAAVALLMPKGDDGGTVTGPTTGGITIHLPIP